LPDAARPPRSKRAVPVRAVPKRAPSAARHVAVDLPDPPPAGRPGFRVPVPVADEAPSTNYALRLTEALEAISSAQNLHQPDAGGPAERDTPGTLTAPRGQPPAQRSAQGTSTAPRSEAPAQRQGRDAPTSPTSERSDAGPTFSRGPREPKRPAIIRLGESFAKLPPIRLPIGPPIPWRFGVPALVLVVVVMVFVARPVPQPSPLPTPGTYPVQQEAPLFTDAQPTPLAVPPLGVAESTAVGFDVLDVGLKLIAVLALAYGSLLLLKRAGMGGAAAIKVGGKSPGLHVVASLTLAPNRTVHLLKAPGGKTLLVGATPNQVNLIADLGDISEDLESEATGSFFDILKGKLSQ
jgi:flagellar biogenesis protein FliO